MTDSIQQQIHEVEVSIERAKHVIEFGKAVERLYENKDFQRVIEEGYFRDEASRLALMSAVPHLDPEKCAHTLRDIQAIGALYQYLQNAVRKGIQMQSDVGQHIETLAELNQADAEQEE